MAPLSGARRDAGCMGEGEQYRRQRRYTRSRIPGKGIEVNEVLSGPDAPYEPRDARFWWTVVGLMLVIVIAAAVGIAVFG